MNKSPRKPRLESGASEQILPNDNSIPGIAHKEAEVTSKKIRAKINKILRPALAVTLAAGLFFAAKDKSESPKIKKDTITIVDKDAGHNNSKEVNEKEQLEQAKAKVYKILEHAGAKTDFSAFSHKDFKRDLKDQLTKNLTPEEIFILSKNDVKPEITIIRQDAPPYEKFADIFEFYIN